MTCCSCKQCEQHAQVVQVEQYLKELGREYPLCKFVHMIWRALVARKKAVLSLAVGCADSDSVNQKARDLQVTQHHFPVLIMSTNLEMKS